MSSCKANQTVVRFVRFLHPSLLCKEGNAPVPNAAAAVHAKAGPASLRVNDLIFSVNKIPGQEVVFGRCEILMNSCLNCPNGCGEQQEGDSFQSSNGAVSAAALRSFLDSRKKKRKEMCQRCRLLWDCGMRGCSAEMIKVRTEAPSSSAGAVTVQLWGRGQNLDSYVTVDGSSKFEGLTPADGDGGWRGPVEWEKNGVLRVHIRDPNRPEVHTGVLCLFMESIMNVDSDGGEEVRSASQASIASDAREDPVLDASGVDSFSDSETQCSYPFLPPPPPVRMRDPPPPPPPPPPASLPVLKILIPNCGREMSSKRIKILEQKVAKFAEAFEAKMEVGIILNPLKWQEATHIVLGDCTSKDTVLERLNASEQSLKKTVS